MKSDAIPQMEEIDETTARFYVIFSETVKADEERNISDASYDEMDEIEQVMRMVVDVSDEPPQFVTST